MWVPKNYEVVTPENLSTLMRSFVLGSRKGPLANLSSKLWSFWRMVVLCGRRNEEYPKEILIAVKEMKAKWIDGLYCIFSLSF